MAYVSNAWKQTQRSKPKNDSASTAGAPKIATVIARSKSELKEWGERMSLAPRTLSKSEINGMSSQEMLWHEAWNGENYKAAFTAEENKKTNKANVAASSTKRMWAGQATEEESQQAYAAAERFASNYSSFVRDTANSQAMVLCMAENNLDATKAQSYVEAFEVLAPQGRLVLSPKAAGIGSEETLSGPALKMYPRLHLLCQPNRVLKPEDKLSADDWFAQHPELHETRMPFVVAVRQERAANTAAHEKNTEAATVSTRNGKTRVVDYGPQGHGVPQSKKYRFRKLVDSMSSTELAERCQQDPAFKKALDEME